MLFSTWDKLWYFHPRFASHVDKQCCKNIFRLQLGLFTQCWWQYLSKTWEKIFSRIKMNRLKYSMYSFFPILEDAFILCIYTFFTDSGRCFLRPKLSLLYSMYPVIIIYMIIYVSSANHHQISRDLLFHLFGGMTIYIYITSLPLPRGKKICDTAN